MRMLKCTYPNGSNYQKTIYGSFYVAKSDYNLITSDMISLEDQSAIRVSVPCLSLESGIFRAFGTGLEPTLEIRVQSFPQEVCGFSLGSSHSQMVWYAY